MTPQHWIGATDVNFMLTEIGDWHVGCQNHREAAIAVAYAEDSGWIGRRVHYAPAIPDGAEAFELTDAGLERVRKLWGDKGYADALEMRQWYRDNTSKPPEKS